MLICSELTLKSEIIGSGSTHVLELHGLGKLLAVGLGEARLGISGTATGSGESGQMLTVDDGLEDLTFERILEHCLCFSSDIAE